jgi:hypothetical protein
MIVINLFFSLFLNNRKITFSESRLKQKITHFLSTKNTNFSSTKIAHFLHQKHSQNTHFPIKNTHFTIKNTDFTRFSHQKHPFPAQKHPFSLSKTPISPSKTPISPSKTPISGSKTPFFLSKTPPKQVPRPLFAAAAHNDRRIRHRDGDHRGKVQMSAFLKLFYAKKRSKTLKNT